LHSQIEELMADIGEPNNVICEFSSPILFIMGSEES
jgi:hypothetical protein